MARNYKVPGTKMTPKWDDPINAHYRNNRERKRAGAQTHANSFPINQYPIIAKLRKEMDRLPARVWVCIGEDEFLNRRSVRAYRQLTRLYKLESQASQ